MIPIPTPTDQAKVSRYTAFVRQVKAIYFILFLIVLLCVLAGLVHSVGVFSFDIQVTHFVQLIRSPLFDRLANAATAAGNAGSLIVVAIVAAVYFGCLRLPKSAVLAIASLLAYPLNVGIKDIVDRARPTSALVKIISPAGGYSFPSGHAMIGMTVYGCIAYLLWTQIKSRRRWLIPSLAGLLIVFIGLSRIYLGVHWFSDVLGGWIGGIILILILAEVHKKWEKGTW